MADREVTRTGKDRDGDITGLCRPGASWSPRPKSLAIVDIEADLHRYFVPWSDGKRTPIRVVNGPHGKYLRTDRDTTTSNNLDELLDC